MTSLIRITEENQIIHLERILEIETLSSSFPWSAGAFVQELHNPISCLWAAVDHGRSAGFICYWMLDFEAHLLNLAVHPEERRKGLGRLLVNRMVEDALSGKLESIWLEVRSSNAGALKLYQAFGFEKAGVRSKYYEDTREDALLMRLALPGASHSSQRYAKGVLS